MLRSMAKYLVQSSIITQESARECSPLWLRSTGTQNARRRLMVSNLYPGSHLTGWSREQDRLDYDIVTNSKQSTRTEDHPGQDVNSDNHLKPSHDPELTIAELNLKYHRQMEIIKSIITILSELWFLRYLHCVDSIIYHDIPCIAPENEGLDFFLPWSNLPRHLAARTVYLTGWPSLCAPIVRDDQVVIGFGPASWDDRQWALMPCLKTPSTSRKLPVSYYQALVRICPHLSVDKHLFELVDTNSEKQSSKLNFSRLWLETNWALLMISTKTM
jgi:hypothetical protein